MADSEELTVSVILVQEAIDGATKELKRIADFLERQEMDQAFCNVAWGVVVKEFLALTRRIVP